LYSDPTKLLADILRKNKDTPSTSKQTVNDNRKRKLDESTTSSMPGLNSAAGVSILPDDFDIPTKQRKIDEQTKIQKSSQSEKFNEIIRQQKLNPGLTISAIPSNIKNVQKKQKEVHTSESARTHFPKVMNSRLISGLKEVNENPAGRPMQLLQQRPTTSKQNQFSFKSTKNSIPPPLNLSSKSNHPFNLKHPSSTNSKLYSNNSSKVVEHLKDRNVSRIQPSLSVTPSTSGNIGAKSVITSTPHALSKNTFKPVHVPPPKNNNTSSTSTNSLLKTTTNNIQQRSAVIIATPKAMTANNSHRLSTSPKVISNISRAIGVPRVPTTTTSSNGTSVQAKALDPIAIPRSKVFQVVPNYIPPQKSSGKL
jgi:hypothetical protein